MKDTRLHILVGSISLMLPTFFFFMTFLPSLFGKENGIVIGVIHFAPLPGIIDAPPLEETLHLALEDLASLEQGGVDGIIIENNYDLPHRIHVQPSTIEAMKTLGMRIRSQTRLPLGVCVLWNDYEASLTIAQAIDAQFIRVPVFVDEVETDFGIVKGNAAGVLTARKTMGADSVKLLVDVHVKHAKLLSNHSLSASIQMAVDGHADGIIITGKWTGDPPSSDDLRIAKNISGDVPIFAGSGANVENVRNILRYANGVIVSTSLKEGTADNAERNLKKWQQRIDVKQVRSLKRQSQFSNSRF